MPVGRPRFGAADPLFGPPQPPDSQSCCRTTAHLLPTTRSRSPGAAPLPFGTGFPPQPRPATPAHARASDRNDPFIPICAKFQGLWGSKRATHLNPEVVPIVYTLEVHRAVSIRITLPRGRAHPSRMSYTVDCATYMSAGNGTSNPHTRRCPLRWAFELQQENQQGAHL